MWLLVYVVMFAGTGRRGRDERILRVLFSRHDEILGNIVNTDSKSQCSALYHPKYL